MKTLLTFIFSCLVCMNLFSQETEIETETDDSGQNFSLSTALVTSYIWRGLAFSNSPNLQPSLSYTNKKGYFTVGSCGSYSLGNYFAEVDLFASLNAGPFTFEVWDYFVMSDTLEKNKYLDYRNESTGHAVEGSIIFNGPESFPITITAATFLYGFDKDSLGDNTYSTYFELAYPFKWRKNNLSVFIGGTPKEGLYASDFAINNIGITNEREIKITDNFSIPISGSIIVNPHLENVYFMLSISLEAND